MTNQSTINIGTIGHVAHGKSTVVHAISGQTTTRWQKELERNITIRLGYASAKIFRCAACPSPSCWQARGSDITETNCTICGAPMSLVRHVAFVDCPGHDVLMQTMINGTSVMDAALLLIAANERCPQPQTQEHVSAVQIMNLRHLIVLQNKVDLVSRKDAETQYHEIVKFIGPTVARGSPVIPISAQLSYNIDYLIEHLVRSIPVPRRDYTAAPRMCVIRSFDTNRPGDDVRKLAGGIAGGSLMWGCLKVGDEIEIRPGTVDKSDPPVCHIRRAIVTSLKADRTELSFAVPGGLIGVGTTLDPAACRADRLAGQVIGRPGTLPEIYVMLTVNVHLFARLVGVVQKGEGGNTTISKLVLNEVVMVNIGSTSTGGKIVAIRGDFAVLMLQPAVCATIGDRIALSRKIESHWRLIGWAKILKGKTAEIA